MQPCTFDPLKITTFLLEPVIPPDYAIFSTSVIT